MECKEHEETAAGVFVPLSILFTANSGKRIERGTNRPTKRSSLSIGDKEGVCIVPTVVMSSLSVPIDDAFIISRPMLFNATRFP